MLLFVQLSLPCALQLQLHQHMHQLVMPALLCRNPCQQQLHTAQSAGLLFLGAMQNKVNDMVSELVACCRWKL